MTALEQPVRSNWTWHQMKPELQADLPNFSANQPSFIKWLSVDMKSAKTHIRVVSHEGTPALYGTLGYECYPFDQNKLQYVHYYMTQDLLITNSIPMEQDERTGLDQKLAGCSSAIDAYFVWIGEIVNSYLVGMDDFEESLRELEHHMKEGHNDGDVLDRIIQLRYKLLHFKSLTIPLLEITLACKEAFMEQLDMCEEYQRTRHRLDRIVALQKHYDTDIATLLSIDDNLTNYRGNEIMRTLTVFTVLFIPVTALGAVWGMNFKNMPELEWKWGYGLSLLVIAVFMLSVYIWLRKKGWTRDLLKGSNSRSHFVKKKSTPKS